jgi:hypothetical protein
VTLPCICGRTNYKIVGKRRNFRQIKNFDIRRLFGASATRRPEPVRN